VQQCRGVSHLSVCMLILVLVLTVATHLLAGKFVSHIDYWDAVSVLNVCSTQKKKKNLAAASSMEVTA
jgi:hypothetical protein